MKPTQAIMMTFRGTIIARKPKSIRDSCMYWWWWGGGGH